MPWEASERVSRSRCGWTGNGARTDLARARLSAPRWHSLSLTLRCERARGFTYEASALNRAYRTFDDTRTILSKKERNACVRSQCAAAAFDSLDPREKVSLHRVNALDAYAFRIDGWNSNERYELSYADGVCVPRETLVLRGAAPKRIMKVRKEVSKWVSE